jgi:hypothetical protein
MIACCCAATAMLVLSLRLPWWVTVGALGAVASVAARTFWRCGGRGVPVSIVVADNRRITVAWGDGNAVAADILDASYVGEWLTTIVWRADDAPWWQPARALLVLPDMLPADDFRRLRVLLRYGVPREVPARNGVQADRPASHARASIRAPLSAFGWPPRRQR